MGQGYSLTTLSAASASIDVPELSDMAHEKTLASARFMKSVRARSPQGFVFVKAVMKPYSTFQVHKYVKQITEERNILANVPNALGYQRIVEVSSGGFLVRQYIFSSVYDRLSTRPFLEDIEKKWLAYQLLCAVRDCHATDVYHGDIKTENLLVTSWNWLYLTDFSSAFKPTYLPEDNPADFSFYFDTSSRRTCYIAPERFTTNSHGDLQGELNWAMDMFSVGCVIAEIFLEGPIFSLHQIFKYRSGEYSPEHTHLNKIDDLDVRAMILNMIELDPEKRYGADQHLSFYKSKIFPEFFDSFLHQYMQDLTESPTSQKPLGLEAGTLAESDDKIERVYHDFDKISFFLGYGTAVEGSLTRLGNPSIPRKSQKRAKASDHDPSLYDGTLLFLTIIVSSLRNTIKASSRLKACDLLVAFAERLPDEAKLDRILPYLVGLLTDSSDTVRAAAIRATASLFDMVEVVSPINAYVFPEYVFPTLKLFIPGPNSRPNPMVRAAYASCLASLALSSTRLLDMLQAMRADGRLTALNENEWAPETSFHALFDVARGELIPHFEEATVALITDTEPSVKRALLGSVSELCIFFGSTKASDVILTHLNTYLNDNDWILKCSFYQALVGVASYVGSSSLKKFILPIMVGSLTDPESFVVEKVFRSLSRMASLGLLEKPTTWELISIAVRFLIHPSSWVRESAVHFIVSSSRYTSKADQYCIILPMIHPFLKVQILNLTEELLLDHLKRPLPRAVFDSAIHWANRKPNSLFWTAASRDGVFTLSDPEVPHTTINLTKRLTSRIPPSQKDKDDQSSLETLRNLGLTADDEMKLIALREYILRISGFKQNEDVVEKQLLLNNIMSLNQIDVTPQNVFFDQKVPIREVKNRPTPRRTRTVQDERHTLVDALLDASTTINPGITEIDNQPPEPINIEERPGGRDIGSPNPDIRVDESETSSSMREFSTSNRPSPVTTDGLTYRRTSHLELKHHNSAINLMNRNDSGKADAEISTSSETAFGRLDGPLHKTDTSKPSALAVTAEMAKKSRSKSPLGQTSVAPIYEPNHSYTGTDPNVLRMLDYHFVENFPVDQLDFGETRPYVESNNPIGRATDMPLNASGKSIPEGINFHKEPWRPTGQLLTQFNEHTGAINRICVAPDHAFFVTASDDGTCKIWDTMRLEKNVTPRSRHTHRHASGSKVKALCFVEHTHTFVSAADDGSIHCVRIDFKRVDGGESTKYGKATLVRDYQIPQTYSPSSVKGTAPSSPECAVWLHHYRTSASQSVLLAATTRHRILAIDMKNMEIIHSMENPVHHGSLSTFCVDRKHHWLLVGTSHGILDLWDLRFKLRLRSFGLPSPARIDRLMRHPTKGQGRWILVSSNGEISIWDIEKMNCREVLRPSTYNADSNPRIYEAWFPDEESSEKILARFARDLSTDEAILEPNMRSSTPSTMNTTSSTVGTSGGARSPTLTIPALYALTDYLSNPAQPSNPNKYTILFSGGSDRTLRYWDLPHLETSFIVSGPMLYTDDGSAAPKVKYDISYPLSLSAGAQIALAAEYTGDKPSSDRDTATGGPQSRATPTRRRTGGIGSGTSTPSRTANTNQSPSGTPSSSRPNTAVAPAGGQAGGSKPPRNTLISQSAAQLLKVHLDTITDITVLRKPYGCVVSVDRAGRIFVFH